MQIMKYAYQLLTLAILYFFIFKALETFNLF